MGELHNTGFCRRASPDSTTVSGLFLLDRPRERDPCVPKSMPRVVRLEDRSSAGQGPHSGLA